MIPTAMPLRWSALKQRLRQQQQKRHRPHPTKSVAVVTTITITRNGFSTIAGSNLPLLYPIQHQQQTSQPDAFLIVKHPATKILLEVQSRTKKDIKVNIKLSATKTSASSVTTALLASSRKVTRGKRIDELKKFKGARHLHHRLRVENIVKGKRDNRFSSFVCLSG